MNRLIWCGLLCAVAMGFGPQPKGAVVFVSVADSHGDPVDGLKAADFLVRADNVDCPVLKADRDSTAPVALIVVPVTLSQDLSSVRDSLGVIRDMVAHGGGEFRLGVSLPTMRQIAMRGPGDDKGALVNDFNRAFTDRTYLEEGIADAARGLAGESTQRRIVFAISHHDLVGSGLPKDANEALHRAGAELWGVEIVPTSAQRTDDVDEIMTTTVKWSGGRSETVPSAGLLVDAVRRMIALIASEYEVHYDGSRVKPAGHLRVGVRRSDVSVAARAWAD